VNFCVDLLVVGGGINGVGIAADASGRNLSVCLCEQDDLASYTSSWSTKLIHGGLRYLEQYDFHLVRESLRERKILHERAPHLVHPIPFYLPHMRGQRPAWLIRFGLWLYDHLASHGNMAGSRSFRLETVLDNPLDSKFKRCFSYTDCQVDDSRLVVINAQLAQKMGAMIKTRCEVVSARCEKNGWEVQVRNKRSAKVEMIRAKAIVNATGPWVDQFGKRLLGSGMREQLRCVQGSHLLLNAFYSGKQAYLLQQPDGRIVFCIPYLGRFCLVGTTDVEFHDDLHHPKMSDEECEYLINAINQSFKKKHTQRDVLGSFAGVRPLYDDHGRSPSTVSRDYHLQCDVVDDELPIIHVVGGKITTYRSLAEDVMKQLNPFFPEMGPSWTKKAVFPGSNWGALCEEEARRAFFERYQHLDDRVLSRLWQNQGLCAYDVLGDATSMSDLGLEILPGLWSKEIEYLIDKEWVLTANDLLWRRTKLGLDYTEEQRTKLEHFFRTRDWERRGLNS
jgi:glycerol-3-phosphate dehydrogenase